MNSLLTVFFDIALFRRGPEDLPASRFLLTASFLAYTVGSVATSAVYTEEIFQIILEVLADISLMLAWYGVLLFLFSRRARLPQTLTALFGTGALLYVVAFPVMSWLQFQVVSQINLPLPTLLMIAILMWSIAVAGHIVHRALEIPIVAGILMGILYFLVSVAVFSILFGESG